MRIRNHLTLTIALLMVVMVAAACGPAVVSDPPEMDTSGEAEGGEAVVESGGEVSQGMPLPPVDDFPAGPHFVRTGQEAIIACDGGASVGGGPTINLTVNNPTDVTFTAYWIDFEGVPQQGEDILPGEGFASESGVLQMWCFREKDTGNYAQGLILGDSDVVYDLTLDAVPLGSTEGGQGGAQYAQSCASLTSVGDGAGVDLTIVNPTESIYLVTWIDFDGNEVDYGELAPGADVVQTTGVGQSWCFREKDTLLHEQGVTLGEGSLTYTISADN